jgi:hypothetical protein
MNALPTDTQIKLDNFNQAIKLGQVLKEIYCEYSTVAEINTVACHNYAPMPGITIHMAHESYTWQEYNIDRRYHPGTENLHTGGESGSDSAAAEPHT